MSSLRVLLSLVALGAALVAGASRPAKTPSPATIRPGAARLPLAFEENAGQADPAALFVARAGRCTAFLTRTDAVFAGGAAPLRMRPVGGDPSARVEGVRELPGRANWYVGNDSAKWRTGIRTFAAVAYRGVWPGVDLVFHGDRRELEYDFVVAPGADAGAIAMRFTGADGLAVDAAGDLVVSLAGGEMRQRRPVVSEETADGTRRDVAGRYVVRGGDVVAFEVDGRDAANRLVIDPVLVYGTYIGGSDDGESNPRVAVDAIGEMLVTSHLQAPDFPTVRAFQATDPSPVHNMVFAVSKLNAAGSAFVYSTYLGGTDGENGYPDVAADAQGSAYVAGYCQATDYPTTPGAYQTSKTSNYPFVVTKLAPAGTLSYSTYFNAPATSFEFFIAVDGAGSAYVTGTCAVDNSSFTFPTTPGAFQTASTGTWTDAIVVKLNPAGTGVVYSTLLGGSDQDVSRAIAVDSLGNAYVAGWTQSNDFPTRNAAQAARAGTQDLFVTKLNPAGSDVVYSTYLGSGTDVATGIAVDSAGRAFVVGNGSPLTIPAATPLVPMTTLTGVLARLSAAGGVDFVTGVVNGTHGTGGDTKAEAVDVDAAGDVYVAGTAAATDMPQLCAVGAGFRGAAYDAFVVKMKGDGSAFVYSTYLGGSGPDYGTGLAVAPTGEAYVGVGTLSTDCTPLRHAMQRTKPSSTSFTSWYVAKLSAESGTGPGGCAPPPSPDRVDSFLLPTSVKAAVNAKDKSKSKLTVTGVFDTGSGAVDLSKPATLDVGAFRFAAAAPVRRGKTYTYKSGGMTLVVTPSATGTSRAAFKLTYVGDLTYRVPQDGELRLHLATGDVDAVGFVNLASGVFAFGKKRGALGEPNLYPKSVKASVLGPGKDAFTVVLSLATDGVTPPAPSDFTFGFEGHFSVTVPASNFVKVGDRFQTKSAFQGVTKVVVDYAKETITVTAKGPDLSTFVAGPNTLIVNVGLGTESRAVTVRAVRKGKTLAY